MEKEPRRPARTCPKGHHMDPTWTKCPYCEAEEKSKEKSSQPAELGYSEGRMTRVGQVPSENQGRVTRQMPAPAREGPKAGGHVGRGEKRRIVGVMITYNTWDNEGELFPVREGRNFIGRGKVSSDASHRNCDIQIPTDEEMSSEHALILCRQDKGELKYHLSDQKSTNGTFLNGEMLNATVELEDQAEIKTGRTVWLFFKIKPSTKMPPQKGKITGGDVKDQKPPKDPTNVG